MYELFYYPGNASMAPHFPLEELGVPFELRLVDRKRNGQKDPEYMKRNPLGRIPTLVDGDLVLFESAAICLHLADRHPEANLARAWERRWAEDVAERPSRLAGIRRCADLIAARPAVQRAVATEGLGSLY